MMKEVGNDITKKNEVVNHRLQKHLVKLTRQEDFVKQQELCKTMQSDIT